GGRGDWGGDELGVGVVVVDLRDGHAQGIEVREPRFGRSVVEPLGMQLLVNELLNSDLFDSFDVAGARAVAEPVEQMYDLLFFGEPCDFTICLCDSGGVDGSAESECDAQCKCYCHGRTAPRP